MKVLKILGISLNASFPKPASRGSSNEVCSVGWLVQFSLCCFALNWSGDIDIAEYVGFITGISLTFSFRLHVKLGTNIKKQINLHCSF